MLSKTLSTSARFAQLFDVCPSLAEFAQSLYTLLVAHSDDFGREEGDAATVKFRFHPRSPRAVEDFTAALAALDAVGLISWYDADGRRCYEIAKFEQHQTGLNKRTHSHFPDPPGSSRNFQDIPVERNLTELNKSSRSRSALRATLSLPEVRRHLQAALHKQLDAAPDTTTDDLAEMVKTLCRPLGFTWNNSGEITALISGVRGVRSKRERRTG
jgi:hypothetical protein